jgi:hypothetical protein
VGSFVDAEHLVEHPVEDLGERFGEDLVEDFVEILVEGLVEGLVEDYAELFVDVDEVERVVEESRNVDMLRRKWKKRPWMGMFKRWYR